MVKLTRKQQPLNIVRTRRIQEFQLVTPDFDSLNLVGGWSSDSGARIIIDNILSEDDYISNEEDTLSEVKRREMKSWRNSRKTRWVLQDE